MNAIHPLDQPIAQWNLLESRFYQAWSAGVLPVAALKRYAAEYGSFIAAVPSGWEAHGDSATAAVERSHVELWRRFARTLGADIETPSNAGAARLTATARKLFDDPAASIGALYAFEAQQPATAASKLQGLREHYDLDPAGEEYFAVHECDEDEPRMLRERFEALSENGKQAAVGACRAMCRDLRGALDSLYDEEAACCVN